MTGITFDGWGVDAIAFAGWGYEPSGEGTPTTSRPMFYLVLDTPQKKLSVEPYAKLLEAEESRKRMSVEVI